MLQAPAHHLSRVCGHGHIKKFWLMQTQKENQSCDQGNKNSVIVSSSSSSSSPIYGSRVSSSTSPTSSSSSSMKLLDVSQRCSPTHITTNHVNNNHLTASSSGFGESPSKGLTHSSSSNFSRGISRSLCQRPSSLLSKECEKAIVQEDSSSDAQVLNVSFSSSSCYSSPAQTPSVNLLSTVEISLMNDRNHEEVCVDDGSPPGPTLESNLTSINGYRDSIIQHKIQETVPIVTPSSDVRILVSKLNEGENVASAARTDIRESGIHLHLHRSSGYEEMNENHMGVSSRENLNRADSCHSLRKIEARPIALDNIGKWKSRNSSSNGSRTEGAPRGSTQLVLKACSLCGTTKTPMWRSGPQGPKSLCNACGIRFKKYRSFPGHNDPDLAVPLLGNSSPSPSKYLPRPLKRKQNSNTLLTQEVGLKPFASDVSRHQKKSKWHELVIKRDQVDLLRDAPNAWKVSSGPASLKKIYGCMQSRFKNIDSSDEHLTIKRVFAKDEEEAAVLLMHLSCGLVC